MMKYLQRLGKSLMLPVAALPAASILMGIGYWIDPTGWGAQNVIAAFLIKAGGALIESQNMAILFAIGVAVGMSDDNDGTAGLAGLVSWLMITTLLSPAAVAMFKGIDVAEVPAAFTKIQTQFIGILSGLIGASCYNRFKNTKLPDALGFFSGKRSVAIVTAISSIIVSVILFFIWPFVYGGLVSFGKAIISTNAVGAGIKGQTGMYMTGFFPVMMFGLPAGALAMYHTAKDNKKKAVYGLLLAAALSSFFTGVTEPLEFAFMFLAPALYVVHAALTGLSVFICALLPVRAGFNFSAGFVDWFLSFKAPMAVKPWLIIPIGLVFAVIYYVLFRVIITRFNLKTPGREDDDEFTENKSISGDMDELAKLYIEALGEKINILSVDNCVTRLRLNVKDASIINDKELKALGARGVIRPGKDSIQIIIGTNVQFVADAIKRQLKK